MAPVSVVVIGAGERGSGYARWAARHPDRASVVAVAEPREVRRVRFAAEHGVAERDAVADWRQRPAPGAARLLAPGPLLRARQLAARRPGGLHADGQVLPRPGLAAAHPGPGAAAGLELRQPDPLHRGQPAGRRRGPLRDLPGRAGLSLLSAAVLRGSARAGRTSLAAQCPGRGLFDKRARRSAAKRPVRPVRLRL